MVVIIVEKAPVGLRGELSRWLIEPHTGIFVGKISGMVRDKLWEKVEKSVRVGGAILIHTAQTEQGFAVRIHGDTNRKLIDFEGLCLVQIINKANSANNEAEKKV